MITSSVQIIGQEEARKLDLRLGTGVSFLGAGDIIAFNYENELNLKISRLLTSSLSMNFGRGGKGTPSTGSFIQGNVNMFISPFGNSNRFDFRIGTGLSFYNIHETYVSFLQYENTELIDKRYEFENRNSFGVNFILETSYLLTGRILLGIKLFAQPYFNGDANSGGMLKVGFRI
jgi:hypothetical protein